MPKGGGKRHSQRRKRERRRSSRIYVKQKIRCHSKDEFLELYSRDFSKGGVFIETPFPPPVGTMLRLGFELPGAKREIELDGKVVQTQSFGAGVQFVDVSKQQMQLIESWINQQRQGTEQQVTFSGKLVHTFVDRHIFASSGKDLNCCSLPLLLMHLKEKAENGVLRIYHNDEFRNLQLREGIPTEIHSSKFNENYCLGRILKRVGSISQEELHASLVAMVRTGKRQGTILLERGLLSWEEIQKGLQWQLEIKLDEILHWQEGEFFFYREEPKQQLDWIEPELDLQQACFHSLYRQARHRDEVTLPLLCNFRDFRIVQGKRPLHLFFHSNQEAALWEHIVSQQPTPRALFNNPELARLDVRAFIVALVATGLVELRHPQAHRQTDKPAPVPNWLESSNYFHRLNLPWTVASKEEIRTAHQRTLALLEPLDAQHCGKLRDKLNEAYTTLENDFQRRSYRKSIIGNEEMRTMAARLYRLGKMKFHRQEFSSAYPLLLSASDLNPGMPEYDHWLAKAKKAYLE